MKKSSAIKRCTVLFAVVTLLALPQAPFAGSTRPIFRGARAPAPPVPQFLVPPIVAVSATPVATVAADFSGDGKIDLAVTNTNGVDILLGNGDGTFQAPVTFAVNGGCSALPWRT
jgi:FG-GAP-like repeat